MIKINGVRTQLAYHQDLGTYTTNAHLIVNLIRGDYVSLTGMSQGNDYLAYTIERL